MTELAFSTEGENLRRRFKKEMRKGDGIRGTGTNPRVTTQLSWSGEGLMELLRWNFFQFTR